MPLSRRMLLKSAATCMIGGLSSGIAPFGIRPCLSAASAGYRAVVCINLEGGNDGINMFMPNDDARYAEYAHARGQLAVERYSLIPVQTRLSRDSFAFHPSMLGMSSLFTQNRLAVLANVGTLSGPTTKNQYRDKSTPLPEFLFSHNAQRNQWQSPTRSRFINDQLGWGGLMADSLQGLNASSQYPAAVSMAGMSTYCTGRVTHAADVVPYNLSGLKGFGQSDFDQRRLAAIKKLLEVKYDQSLLSSYSKYSNGAFDEIAVYKDVVDAMPALKTTFPNTRLGLQLHQVARMLQARWLLGLNRQIFYVSQQGFDTHSQQLYKQVSLLEELDEAMIAFYKATEELGVESDVLSFTISDFGRTVKPANGGSDHAWGNHHIVMGGSVKGGEVYGKVPSLALGGADDASTKGRLIPTTAVDQYAATIAAWMGVSDADILAMFPNLRNFDTQRLGFI